MAKYKKPDNSARIPQRDKIKDSLNIKEFPWTEKQKEFIKLALDKDTKIIFVDALWGTGKSLLAVYAALKLLNEKRVSDIIYLRSAVESTTTGKLGFLKGEFSDKLKPYTAPFFDKLDELLSANEVTSLITKERVSCNCPNFIRGLSWNAKAVIVDEASCMTQEDLFLILSRIGEFTKVFIIGDSLQNDIGNKSGFIKVFNAFKDNEESKANGVFTREFKDENDVMRSKLLRYLMKEIRKLK